MLPRPLLLRLLGIATGSFALAAVWSLYNVFMPLLLGEYIESRALRGAIMGLDNVIAIALIPVVGAWSDRVDGRWGRRLPFLLVGVPLAALSFAALPWAAAALWALLIVDVVFLIAITFYRAPLVALMPDHVPEERRSEANGIITLTAAVGGVAALVLLAPSFDRSSALPFALAGTWALLALGVLLLAAQPHPPYVQRGSVNAEAPFLVSLLRDVAALRHPNQRPLLVLLAALFAAFFGFAAVEAQFSVVATETLGLSGGVAGRLFGVAGGAFVLLALPSGALARRFGALACMRLGASALALALTLLAIVVALPFGAASVTLVGVALASAGASWALVLVPAYPLVVERVAGERTGFATGLYYLVGSGAAIVAPASVGLAMDVFGNVTLFVAAAAALVLCAGLLALAQRR